MSEQNDDLPEVEGGHPPDSDALPTCPIDPEERLDTERVLGLFAPRTPRLKRERLLALVHGVKRAAVAPRATMIQVRTPWYWPAATALMTATSLALAVLLVVRANAEPAIRVEYQERIVYQPVYLPSSSAAAGTAKDEAVVTVPQPAPAIARQPKAPDEYLKNRDIALSMGVESMEFRRPAGQEGALNSPATRDELLRQLGPTRTMRTGVATKGWIWPSW
jgi:hypothetical protein